MPLLWLLLVTNAFAPGPALANGADSGYQPSSTSLSMEARNIADGLQINDPVKQLVDLRSQLAEKSDLDKTIQLILLRQDLTDALLSTTCEVRAVMTRIDREIAQAHEQNVFMTQRRDKAIRLNTYANAVSGGLTGIVAGALRLGLGESISPNLVDTSEGTIQTGLSTWAIYQEKGDTKQIVGTSNMLAMLFGRESVVALDYPPQVWSYLNSAPPGHDIGQTRRKLLINKWSRLGLLGPARNAPSSRDRIARITGTVAGSHSLTIDLLDTRIAMLVDLRSVVSEMDTPLFELINFIRGKPGSITHQHYLPPASTAVPDNR